MTAKYLSARVGPASEDNSMDRVEEKGNGSFYRRGGGFVPESKDKTKDGDESRDMAGVMGGGTGSWQTKLNDGAESVYPDTPEALKTKNTRKNNDSFFPG